MPAARRVKSCIGALAALILSLPTFPTQASPQDLAAAIEATYVARLAHFITWPPGAFPNTGAPLVICVQGADPFGAVLDRLVEERHIGERAIVIRRLVRVDPRSGCQVAYIGGSSAQSQAQALDAVDDAPVVTITDERRGPAPHGMFHFMEDGPRLRFVVDANKADDNGIAVSSKLLALAAAVKR